MTTWAFANLVAYYWIADRNSILSRNVFLEVLGLKTRSSNISISGINKTVTNFFRATEVRLQSRTNCFSFALDYIVIRSRN